MNRSNWIKTDKSWQGQPGRRKSSNAWFYQENMSSPGFPVRVLAVAEGHAMVRSTGCMVFIAAESELYEIKEMQ